jgi:hypothetical protein
MLQQGSVRLDLQPDEVKGRVPQERRQQAGALQSTTKKGGSKLPHSKLTLTRVRSFAFVGFEGCA